MSYHRYSIALLIGQFLFGTVSSTTTCYRPNGIEGDSDIRPCHPDLPSGQYSACCNLGKSPADLCLAGGLCYRQDGYDGNFLIYAVGCTDPTGADAACQQYCPTGNGVVMYSLNACLDGRWCCNNLSNSESCCDKSTGEGSFTMNHLLSLDPTPSATSSGVSSSAGIATTMTSGQSQTSTASCVSASCTDKTGVLVGASLGAAMGGFIIAVVASCLFMSRFKMSSRHRKGAEEHGPVNVDVSATGAQRQSGWRHEMDTKSQTLMKVDQADTNFSELPHQMANMHEMDSTSSRAARKR